MNLSCTGFQVCTAWLPEQPSLWEACRFLSFSFQSFITPTLIYRSCLNFSLYRFIINNSLYHKHSSTNEFQRFPTRISTEPLQPLYIPTTRHIHPFLPQTVSQDHTHLPPDTYRRHPIRDFDTPRFILCVYGFELSDRIWLVSIVMTLVVDCLLRCAFSTIFTGPPYIPFCLYRLSKCHMMWVQF